MLEKLLDFLSLPWRDWSLRWCAHCTCGCKYYVGLPDAKKDIPRLLFLYNSASKTSLQGVTPRVRFGRQNKYSKAVAATKGGLV